MRYRHGKIGKNLSVSIHFLSDGLCESFFGFKETDTFTLIENNFAEFPFFIDRYLFKTQPQQPTLDNIQRDFGECSAVFLNAMLVMQAHLPALDNQSKLHTAYQQWKKFLHIAYGQFDGSREEMFFVHTYLSVFSKILAYTVISENKAYLPEQQLRDIWKFILQNSYKPIFLKQQFDFVIGNPPWLTYADVTNATYQHELQELAQIYVLVPVNKANMPHLEIAAIFLAHAANYFLKAGGSQVAHHSINRKKSQSTNLENENMREKTQQAILGSITRLIVLLALCIPPPTYATLGIDWLANHQAQEEGHYSTKDDLATPVMATVETLRTFLRQGETQATQPSMTEALDFLNATAFSSTKMLSSVKIRLRIKRRDAFMKITWNLLKPKLSFFLMKQVALEI